MTAEARLDITGSTEEAQKQIDKLTKKLAGMQEQLRTMRDDSKKQAHESHGFIGEQIADLGRMAVGFVTVEKGVEKVVEFYREWQEELHKTGEAHEKFTSNLIRNLAKAGKVAEAQHVEHFLSNIQGATREQAEATFAGVRGAAPLESTARQEQLTKAALSMAPALKEPSELGAFGSATGLVGKLMPQTEAGDVADVAAKMQAVMGDQFGDLGEDKMQRGIKSMISAGMSPEDALGLVVSAKRANAKRGIMDKMFSIMEATKKELRPTPTDHSEKAKAERKLARVEGLDRFKMLLSDPAMSSALGESASEFRRLAPMLGKGGGDELRAAEHDDFAQISKQLATTPIGKEALASQAIALQKEEFTKRHGQQQALITQAEESELATARLKGRGAAGFVRVGQAWQYAKRAFEGEAEGRRQLESQIAPGSLADPAAQDAIRAYLKEQTELMRDEKLSRHRNVDAHTE